MRLPSGLIANNLFFLDPKRLIDIPICIGITASYFYRTIVIINHIFKIPADFTFRQIVEIRWANNNTYSNVYLGRIQMEFQF